MGISVIGSWRNFNCLNPFGKYEAFVNWENCIYNKDNDISDSFPLIDAFFGFESLANQADLIVGFNSLSFDDNLLRANGFEVPSTSFDLLVEVRKASGQGDGHYHYGITRKGYALKDLAAANLKYNKTGSGELAPVLWQQGKHQEVIDYCLRDIRITKELYFKFINNQLIDPLDDYVLIGNEKTFKYNLFDYQEHLEWVKKPYQNDLIEDEIPF
jgi:hypothetical protein